MRRMLLSVCLFGCGSDSDSDSDASTTLTTTATTCPGGTNCAESSGGEGSGSASSDGSASSASSNATSSGSDDGATSMATFVPVTSSGADESTGTPADCSMTPDCASCWACAKAGPCNAGYGACEAAFNCIPSLVCSEGCAADGLQQDCVSTCCMSCTDLMTCPMVDAVISCIEGECAAQCGAVSCP